METNNEPASEMIAEETGYIVEAVVKNVRDGIASDVVVDADGSHIVEEAGGGHRVILVNRWYRNVTCGVFLTLAVAGVYLGVANPTLSVFSYVFYAFSLLAVLFAVKSRSSGKVVLGDEGIEIFDAKRQKIGWAGVVGARVVDDRKLGFGAKIPVVELAGLGDRRLGEMSTKQGVLAESFVALVHAHLGIRIDSSAPEDVIAADTDTGGETSTDDDPLHKGESHG